MSKKPTLAMAFVSLPVILRQIFAAREEEAGGSSPITVFRPWEKIKSEYY